MGEHIKRYTRRPPNAFFLFSNENRRKLLNQNPELGNRDISRMLGNLWSHLESDKKKEFMRRAEEIHAKHIKEYPGYKFNPWTSKRLRERQTNSQMTNSLIDNRSSTLIIWRPRTQLQTPVFTEQLPKLQTNEPTIKREVESISEEKRLFTQYLGLCQQNSTEYFNIMAKQAINARKYPVLAIIQTFQFHNRRNFKTKCKDQNTNQNNVKRPRGRPRKYFPNTKIPLNQLNGV